jgi:alanyl-tRNA synthetase
LSVAPFAVAERLATLRAEVEMLEAQVKKREAAGVLSADKLLAAAGMVGDTTVVVAEAPGADPSSMRQLIDAVRQKVQPAAVLLATVEGDDKVTLVAGVTKDLEARGASAGKWIGPVAKELGGGGGGRADLAQAGGKEPAKLASALAKAQETIAAMLGA